MAQLYIGTSGYDYPEWAGVFYPDNLKRKDYLAYYADVFNAVEINSTFYRMPMSHQMMSLANRSGDRLRFSVKANRLLTHEIPANWKNEARSFIDAVKPLHDRGLLGNILFQLPQSFHRTPDNRLYLAELLKVFGDYPLAVEFRHKEWVRHSVFEGLAERNVSFVFCDMPQLPSLPSLLYDNSITERVQHSAGMERMYLRLHGRNSDAWYAGDSSSNGSQRYDYQYTEDELALFASEIRIIAGHSKSVDVFFNNHPRGYGVQNAIRLKEFLS